MNPLMEMMRMAADQEEDDDDRHPLSAEAQAENLRAAWDWYSRAKNFRPGDIVRSRKGLEIHNRETVMLFDRYLSDDDQDRRIQAVTHGRIKFNRVDCMVAVCDGAGHISFEPHDSNLLEPFDPTDECPS